MDNASQEEQAPNNHSDSLQDRLLSSKCRPLAADVANVALDLLISELVVNHTNKSNRVTEELEGRNFGTPDDHGRNNEDDVLENTAESEDHGGSLADLEVGLVLDLLIKKRLEESYQ